MFSFVFFMLGLAAASPFKSFTTAVDFFQVRFPHYKMEFIISFVYSATSVPTLLFMVRRGFKLSYDVRIYVFLVVAFLSVAMIPVIDFSRPPNCPFALSSMLFCVFISGIAAGVLYPSFFGLASSFPRTATVYMMTGLGLAGLTIIIARIGTKASMAQNDDSIRTASYIYFAISAFTIFCSLLSYIWLRTSESSTPYIKDLTNKKKAVAKEETTSLLGTNKQGSINREREQLEELRSDTLANGDSAVDAKSGVAVAVMVAQTEVGNVPVNAGSNKKLAYGDIHKRVFWTGSALCFNMVVTSSCFPGLVTEIPSTDPHLQKTKWFSIFCVTAFVVGDSIGRFSPYFIKDIGKRFSDLRLWILVSIRLLSIPLFWICIHPRVIQSDPLVYVFVLYFSLTNGIAVSACSSAVPLRVSTPEERRLAGTFASLCLNGGIFIGSVVAIGLLYAISGVLPF
eukprot:ANDGO_05824.mRNA.1 Equilibrative nucleotide transporter 8